MGNSESKPSFRQSLAVFTSSLQSVNGEDDGFWESFWSQPAGTALQLFSDVTIEDVRRLRHDCPSNLASLCFKAVEKLVCASEVGCTTEEEQNSVVNSVHLLLRVLPLLLEDSEWRCLLWSSASCRSDHVLTLPPADEDQKQQDQLVPAQQLILAVCDLLFCPDFTVVSSHTPACADSHRSSGAASFPEQHEDIQSIDSCEFIWAAGVGFTTDPVQCSSRDHHRTLLLKLLLVCFSESIYSPPPAEDGEGDDEVRCDDGVNRWLSYFVSSANRHALPLFTSLLNVVCSYDPAGSGIPYNHVLFGDCREQLVQSALHVLTLSLDHGGSGGGGGPSTSVLGPTSADTGAHGSVDSDVNSPKNSEDVQSNLFVNYLSRIHREEDFEFILKGFTRLLNNPLQQTLLPHSTKKVSFQQELLVLFWKCCDYNKKLLYHVLKSSSVLQVAVPLLYHAHASRSDAGRLGLVHIAVFVLLLLSGERNFGVRLNRPYLGGACMDVPVFSGTHGDLLVVVFHKIVTTGHQRLQPLFDCLLTILVNVSPYLKSLSMVSATKLIHLLEAFSTPWFLFCSPTNHHLVFFLLEMFNNIIQYQFDGNSNLVYTIIRKRHIFHSLVNLPTDAATIDKSLQAKRSRLIANVTSSCSTDQVAGGLLPDPGTLSATLLNSTDADDSTDNTSTGAHQMAVFSVGGDVTASRDSQGGPPASPDRGSSSAGDSGGSRSPDSVAPGPDWTATPRWVLSWKNRLPLQTIMRLLQVLVPQVEKICIDKGLTDESEILRFLQHGTLVGLLPVPHPILIRKYQSNSGTAHWFRTYLWSVIYLRNVDPPIWHGTAVRLFDIQ